MWEQQLIETTRGIFEIFTKGEGKPLCVTHLYSEFNENGNRFAEMFTSFYKVHLVNLRGCGKSTDDVSFFNYGMQDSVEDLEAIRKALGYVAWGFAGHSTGGMLALNYAILHPASVEFIVAGGLCASAEYMHHPASIYCKENPNNKRILEILAMLGNPSSTAEQRNAGSKEWALMSLYKEQSYDNMISRPSSGKTVSKRLDYFSYKELPEFDLRPQLPTVKTKAYIYGGLYDAQCPYEFAVEAADLLANATLTTFAESNHHPVIEEEEKFTEFVRNLSKVHSIQN